MNTQPSPETVQDRIIYKGSRIDLVQRSVRTRTGKTIQREVVVHPGAVIILPVLDNGEIVMIKNHRHTVNQTLWELPAGTLDRPEAPMDCARRELIEETGYACDEIRPFGWFYTSPGIITEKMFAFVATRLRAGPQQLEENEDIVVQALSQKAIRSMVADNAIADGKTLAVLLKYLAE